MIAAPEVSVVMGVYNGASVLRDSVQSLLAQDGVDIELITVNDGSTDGSGELLDQLAGGDSRLRVIHQSNQGLTRALIRGCSEARGEFIARQDAGDISLPGRLRTQVRAMAEHPDAAVVSCGTRFVGPEGEPLYEVIPAEADVTSGLRALDLATVRGPSHHGSTLFRRDLYERGGGYREHFYYAQDLDLWVRLVEIGRHIVVPVIFYQASFVVDSISGIHRARQIELTRMILECARRRRLGVDETEVLERAAAVRPRSSNGTTRLERAKALYFIGSCLRVQGNGMSKKYFWKAVRTCPLHLKSIFRLVVG